MALALLRRSGELPYEEAVENVLRLPQKDELPSAELDGAMLGVMIGANISDSEREESDSSSTSDLSSEDGESDLPPPLLSDERINQIVDDALLGILPQRPSNQVTEASAVRERTARREDYCAIS